MALGILRDTHKHTDSVWTSSSELQLTILTQLHVMSYTACFKKHVIGTKQQTKLPSSLPYVYI